MITAAHDSEIRRLFRTVSSKTVADIFYEDDQREVVLIFIDGTRLRLFLDSPIARVDTSQANGKGGWE